MSNNRVDRVLNHALGLAGALTQEAEAVRELIAVSEQDRALLAEALERVKDEIERVRSRPSPATDDSGPPEAPALLAQRLLQEAIALTASD